MITDVKLVISNRKKEKNLCDEEIQYCDTIEEAKLKGEAIWQRVRMQRNPKVRSAVILYREDGALKQEFVFTGL